MNLDLQINIQKSTLTPVQCLEFIGVNLDSLQVRALLPQHRFHSLSTLRDSSSQPSKHRPDVPPASAAHSGWYVCNISWQTTDEVSADMVQLGL